MRIEILAVLACLAAAPAAAQAPLVAEGATPGQSIQIRDLKRDAAGTLTLRFTLINDSCCGVSGVMLRAKPSDSSRKPSGVKLVDQASGREFLPLRGADGECVCSEMPNTGRGERANLWVKFAGVPAELRTLGVEVRSFEPVSGVPVTGP